MRLSKKVESYLIKMNISLSKFTNEYTNPYDGKKYYITDDMDDMGMTLAITKDCQDYDYLAI